MVNQLLGPRYLKRSPTQLLDACVVLWKRKSMSNTSNSSPRQTEVRPRRDANQIAIKLGITLFLFAGVAIAVVLIAMCFVPTFGRFWE